MKEASQKGLKVMKVGITQVSPKTWSIPKGIESYLYLSLSYIEKEASQKGLKAI